MNMKIRTLRKVLPTVLATVFTIMAGMAFAAPTTLFGEGRTPLGAGDAASVRNAAKQEAIRDAVVKGIKDATALDASDPRFASIIDEVAKQLRDVQVREERREGSDLVTRIEANVDRVQIKNAIRGTELDKLNDRSFSILMLVDEFVTSTRDLNMPLKELEEFNYDAGSSHRDQSVKANAASASSKSALAASSSVNAASAASARASGSSSAAAAASGRDAYGSGSIAASERSNFQGQSAAASQYQSKDNLAASAASKSARSAIDKKNVDDRSHEKASYRKLVEYQDTSKPTSNSTFLGAFAGNLRDYDLRLLDASDARSKFFGGRTVTLSALSNSAEMAKFNEFARTKANADFLMIGNSTVVSGGINPATDLMTCSVSANIKAFATAGGEVIASAARSTQASGETIEACAASASTKIADLIAPEFASRALGYWADRAARGRQYTVELKGSGLPFPMRLAFAKALRDIQGATDVEKKEDGETGVKVTMTLKGKGDAMEEVYGAVSSHAAFSGKYLDGKVAGENIVLCLNKCVGDAQPTSGKKKK
jgi:hypothetical protein